MGIKDLKKGLLKTFGEATVNLLDAKESAREAHSTGVLSFDYATVIGGLPKGFYCEIAGKESAGKTTYAATWVAELQKQGKFVLWIDYENSFDHIYFKNLGVQFDDHLWLRVQPDTLEDGFQMILRVLNDTEIDVGGFVIDSLAIAPTNREMEKLEKDERSLGKRIMGTQASTVAQILKVINPFFHKRKDATLLVINQLRTHIENWGSFDETTGGKAMRYAFHLRQRIKRTGFIKEGSNVKGLRLKLTTNKSKVGTPMREVETDLIFGEGFDIPSDAFAVGLSTGVIKKNASMYELPDSSWSAMRGVNGFRELYLKDELFRAEIRKRVLACGAPTVSVAIADEELGKSTQHIDEDAEVDGASILEANKAGHTAEFGQKVDLSKPPVIATDEALEEVKKVAKKVAKKKKETKTDG